MDKKKVCGIIIVAKFANDTRCLMLRRSAEVNNPLIWSFPMGHADPSEMTLYDYAESKREKFDILLSVALRELEEEAGLKREHIGRVAPFYLKISKKRKNIYFFFTRITVKQYHIINDDIVLNYENDDFKWFDLESFVSDNSLHHSINDNFDLFLEAINGL